jgi:uncharacterized protein YjdB
MKIVGNTAYLALQEVKRCLMELEDAMERTSTTDITDFRAVARGVVSAVNGAFVTAFQTVAAVVSVTLTPATLALVVGETAQLSWALDPHDASDYAVTFTSSDEAKATVSALGVVTAVAAGSATITVTTHDGNKTDTCAVTVTTE